MIATCRVSRCDDYIFSLGLCSKHYQRFRKYGNPELYIVRPKYYKRYRSIPVSTICVADNCLIRARTKGLCEKHYTRKRNHGDINTVLKVVGENRTKHPLYKAYHAMLDRCGNPKNEKYGYYGGRGITVCDRWKGIDGFSSFLADMGDRPPNMTLDRVDNNRGYSPENCKWETRRNQQLNQRTSSKNTSGTTGVSLYANGKWTAQVYYQHKKKHLGYFDTKEEAIAARILAKNVLV